MAQTSESNSCQRGAVPQRLVFKLLITHHTAKILGLGVNWYANVIMRNWDEQLFAIFSSADMCGTNSPAGSALHGHDRNGFVRIHGQVKIPKCLKDNPNGKQQLAKFFFTAKSATNVEIICVNAQTIADPAGWQVLIDGVEHEHNQAVPKQWCCFAALPQPFGCIYWNGLTIMHDMISGVHMPFPQ